MTVSKKREKREGGRNKEERTERKGREGGGTEEGELEEERYEGRKGVRDQVKAEKKREKDEGLREGEQIQ